MTAFFEKYLEIIKLLLAAAIVFIACFITWKLTDGNWQKKWDSEQLAQQAATLKQTNEFRQKEQGYQNAINKANEDGATKLAAAQKDAQDANASVARSSANIERLRQQINAAIVASNAASNSGSSGTGKTASQAVNLLTDVLGKSIERNRQLAAFADDAFERGMTCQNSYEALVSLQGTDSVKK